MAAPPMMALNRLLRWSLGGVGRARRQQDWTPRQLPYCGVGAVAVQWWRGAVVCAGHDAPVVIVWVVWGQVQWWRCSGGAVRWCGWCGGRWEKTPHGKRCRPTECQLKRCRLRFWHPCNAACAGPYGHSRRVLAEALEWPLGNRQRSLTAWRAVVGSYLYGYSWRTSLALAVLLALALPPAHPLAPACVVLICAVPVYVVVVGAVAGTVDLPAGGRQGLAVAAAVGAAATWGLGPLGLVRLGQLAVLLVQVRDVEVKMVGKGNRTEGKRREGKRMHGNCLQHFLNVFLGLPSPNVHFYPLPPPITSPKALHCRRRNVEVAVRANGQLLQVGGVTKRDGGGAKSGGGGGGGGGTSTSDIRYRKQCALRSGVRCCGTHTVLQLDGVGVWGRRRHKHRRRRHKHSGVWYVMSNTNWGQGGRS